MVNAPTIFSLFSLVIIIGMFTAGMVQYVDTTNEVYLQNESSSEVKFKAFDQIAGADNVSGTIQGDVETAEGITSQFTDTPTSLIEASFKGVKTIFATPVLLKNIVTSAGVISADSGFGIPAILWTGILSLIFAAMIFGVLYAVMKIKF